MIAYLDDLTILQNSALHKTKHCVTIKCETLSSAFTLRFEVESSNSLSIKTKT